MYGEICSKLHLSFVLNKTFNLSRMLVGKFSSSRLLTQGGLLSLSTIPIPLKYCSLIENPSGNASCQADMKSFMWNLLPFWRMLFATIFANNSWLYSYLPVSLFFVVKWSKSWETIDSGTIPSKDSTVISFVISSNFQEFSVSTPEREQIITGLVFFTKVFKLTQHQSQNAKFVTAFQNSQFFIDFNATEFFQRFVKFALRTLYGSQQLGMCKKMLSVHFVFILGARVGCQSQQIVNFLQFWLDFPQFKVLVKDFQNWLVFNFQIKLGFLHVFILIF